MTRRRTLQTIIASSLLASLAPWVMAAENEQGGLWVWSQQDGEQQAIFLSRQVGEEWAEPEKLTDNQALNVVPAVIKTGDQGLFVVWSAYENEQAQLRYLSESNGKWSAETTYASGMTSNTAPVAGKDGDGTIWLAWAGFNGVADEIYYATGDGTTFSAPTQLTSNEVPDILPVLGFDQASGAPWLQWQQFSAEGYRTYEVSWQGSGWSEPVQVIDPQTFSEETGGHATQPSLRVSGSEFSLTASLPASQEVVEQPEVLEIEIPEFISDPESASVFLPGYPVQSMPVRAMQQVEE